MWCLRCGGRIEEARNAKFYQGKGPYGNVCVKRIIQLEKEKQKAVQPLELVGDEPTKKR